MQDDDRDFSLDHELDDHESDDHDFVEPENEKENSINKEKLVLGYLLEHSKQHAKELVELAIKFENRGMNDTATIILNAVYDYEKGNAKLDAAIETI